MIANKVKFLLIGENILQKQPWPLQKGKKATQNQNRKVHYIGMEVPQYKIGLETPFLARPSATYGPWHSVEWDINFGDQIKNNHVVMQESLQCLVHQLMTNAESPSTDLVV